MTVRFHVVNLMISCRSDGKDEKCEGEGKDGKGENSCNLFQLECKAVNLYRC